MKKIIMAMLLGVLIIGCGKEMNWYKAPYAEKTIMAKGVADYDEILSNKDVTITGATFHRGSTQREAIYSYFARTMNNGHLIEVMAVDDFDFNELNKLLKEYDYVVVPFTEEEYNKMLDDVNIKNNPDLKDEPELYMFNLVPKKYIK